MAESRPQPEPVRRVHFLLFMVLSMVAISVVGTGCSTVPEDLRASATATGQGLAPVPQSPQDEILNLLGTLPAGKPIQLRDGETVRPEIPYAAASGRQCRMVRFGGGESGYAKLACAFPAGWQWVAPVLP